MVIENIRIWIAVLDEQQKVKACMSTVVETVSGSQYFIREVEKCISGGIFHNESVCYEKLEHLAVGERMIIRRKDSAAIQTSIIKRIERGTSVLA